MLPSRASRDNHSSLMPVSPSWASEGGGLEVQLSWGSACVALLALSTAVYRVDSPFGKAQGLSADEKH